jgi:hypothetical protein
VVLLFAAQLVELVGNVTQWLGLMETASSLATFG